MNLILIKKKINTYLFNALVISIYAFIWAPIVIIVLSAFDPSPDFTFPPTGLSLKWFFSFFSNEMFMTSFFLVSLPVAIGVALISTPIGVLGAMGLVRYSFKGRNFLETFFVLPMLVPEVLLGVALLLFFIKLNIKLTLFSLIIGHVVITIPYVVRSVSVSLHGVKPMLEEAARMLGATKIQVFFKVILPLIRSGIISGALFSFIISFGDINLALFLTGPDTATIPVHIYSEIQWQGDPTIAAISAIQIIIVGLILGIINKTFKIRMTL